MLEELAMGWRVRFFKKTESLVSALDMLEHSSVTVAVRDDFKFARKVRTARKIIAAELIRRDVLFWDGELK